MNIIVKLVEIIVFSQILLEPCLRLCGLLTCLLYKPFQSDEFLHVQKHMWSYPC